MIGDTNTNTNTDTDTDTDIAAGPAAGCHTLLIEHPASGHKRSDSTFAELRAPDLLAAGALLSARRPG